MGSCGRRFESCRPETAMEFLRVVRLFKLNAPNRHSVLPAQEDCFLPWVFETCEARNIDNISTACSELAFFEDSKPETVKYIGSGGCVRNQLKSLH